MRTVVDERLREEAVRFAFVHRCDECVHSASAENEIACASEWPTADHRLPIATASIVVFCKEFEAA